ncbi:MgtC/SapB family protein [Phyllobacterium sp. A18/5-2]|jgi:putative Mg2+ transporter-C (MgtC) family protein|nr:MgtC/SapB family protein [Phyllobacterium sp. A18/5-2]UXN65097.1 MgtC/SapB family protein [Phyllobacterium sp. A18/5-2]
MENFLDLTFPQTTLPISSILARLLLAAVLGSLLGMEREWRRRPAGLKTHIMVCMASATFAIVALETVAVPEFQRESVRMDPLRLIEAATSGVAFLVAGFIIVSRGEVRGITTGAALWLASSVGLASGLGFWWIAIPASLMAVFLLIVVRRLEIGMGAERRGSGKLSDDEAGNH